MIRARYGRIVNVSSIVAAMGSWSASFRTAAKAGLVGLTRSIAREVASRNVTANVVEPGPVTTAMTDASPRPRKDLLTGAMPMGRFGTPTRWRQWSPSCATMPPRSSPGSWSRSTAASAWVAEPLVPVPHDTKEVIPWIVQPPSMPSPRPPSTCRRAGRPGHRAGLFADDLDADSLDLVELVMQLEDSLDVTIDEDDLGEVRTVGDAVDLILAASAAST